MNASTRPAVLFADPWFAFYQPASLRKQGTEIRVSNLEIGTAWKLLFHRSFRPDFTRRELADFNTHFAQKQSVKLSEAGREQIEAFLNLLNRCFQEWSGACRPPWPKRETHC
jgi:hypothetical protein